MKAQFSVEPASGGAGAPRVRVLRVGGEIDTSNAADFEALVAAQSGVGGQVLDLTPIEYCDSAGFAAIDRILAKGGTAVVLGPTNPVRRAASIMGLPLYDSVDDAALALGD